MRGIKFYTDSGYFFYKAKLGGQNLSVVNPLIMCILSNQVILIKHLFDLITDPLSHSFKSCLQWIKSCRVVLFHTQVLISVKLMIIIFVIISNKENIARGRKLN